MWYRSAVINGLHGTGVGPTAEDGELILTKVLQVIEKGLKGRGAGEEIYMEPIWERVNARQNPGQLLRSLYEGTQRQDRAAVLLDQCQVTM